MGEIASTRRRPDPGTVDSMNCSICDTAMKVTRNVVGHRGYVAAMADIKECYDEFVCPHEAEKWHIHIVKLNDYLPTVPSIYLQNKIHYEIAETLQNRRVPFDQI